MTLSDIIAWVETKNQPQQFRFEPDTFARWRNRTGDPILSAARRAHGGEGRCSWGTAAMICSTSWGAHQIMGFNLYGSAIAYPGTVLEFLSGKGQQAAFDAFARSLGIHEITREDIVDDRAKRELVARKWNGAGNIEDYAALLLKAALV